MTRAQFNALKAPKTAPVQSAPKTMSRAQFNSLKGQPKTMTRAEFNAKKPQKQSFFNRTMNQLIKPVSSASNALEDVGKIAGFGLGKAMGAQGSFQDWAKKGDIAPWQHQKDVWSGRSQRTYSDITREIGNQQDNAVLKNAIKTVGYGGDFLLDPLNKLKLLSLTQKGNQALKTGKLALSAGEQATKGQRALVQVGKYSVLPKAIDKAVLGGTTKLNDLIRGTETGGKVMTGLSKVSGKIRPAGVSREEFKLLTDAKTAARNTIGYTTDKAIKFGKGLAKTLSDRKATQLERASLLHAIEKGNEKLAPVAFQDLWKQGVDFKATNEEMWKKLGGSILEGHGLSHVATKEVAEQARKDAFKGQGGFKLTSTKTPQDIHRQWMKVDGKIVNIGDEGIQYRKGKGFVKPVEKPVLSETNANPLIQEARKYKSAEEFWDSWVFKKKDPVVDGKSVGKDFMELKPLVSYRKASDFLGFGEYKFNEGVLKGKIGAGEKLTDGKVNHWKERISKGEKPIVIIEDKPYISKITDNLQGGRKYDAILEARVRQGHSRLEAYKQLGIKEVPVVYKSQLTDIWNKSQPLQEGGSLIQEAKPKLEKGYVRVYHRTDSNPEDLLKGIYSKENRNEFFVSNKKAGQAEGYGKNVVELRVKKSDLSINDEFPSGEKHYTLDAKKATEYLKSQSQPLQEGVAKTRKQWLPANVEQASAMEINNARTAQGKAPIFQEDLPIVAAKMGVSTGRKQAATEFLEATKGLKSEEAKALANEVHDKMVNPESLRKALQIFDSVQNIWKAQALVAPSYHIRNFAGNLWNNYLAGVNNPAPYVLAGEIQKFSVTGKLSKPALWTLKKAGYGVDDIPKLIKEMEQHGVIGTGQYLGDIAQAIDSRIGKTSYINPLSQNFAGYKANKLIGGGVEDNAKIAHYIFKKAEGYGAKQAAESVKKFLFDYGDLTDTEKGLLKRIMPFYTWTSKNIPLQIQQFVENPGKFSKIATAKKDIEQGVPQPDEKYMSDYMKGNSPIRTKVDKDGNTLYFLSGAWLPATSALAFLQDPVSNSLGMVTPALKLPYENLTGKGTFFKNTLGQYEDIQKYPGQKTSYLGLDMNPQTVNNLRSIRALNELNNLNPGGIFGTKNSPSIFQGLLPNASNVRGGQKTPETTQQDRVLNSFVGKLQGYNPEQSKTYYDRDTQSRITEYNSEINRALSNNQTELASGIIKEMEQFVQERDGKPNKALEMYNLIGDQYFQDQAQNKMAEKNRANIRDEMKTQIRQGLQTGNNDMVMEALKKDPTYAEQALKDAIKEQQTQSPEQQKILYQYEQAKIRKRLNPFFK